MKSILYRLSYLYIQDYSIYTNECKQHTTRIVYTLFNCTIQNNFNLSFSPPKTVAHV